MYNIELVLRDETRGMNKMIQNTLNISELQKRKKNTGERGYLLCDNDNKNNINNNSIGNVIWN